MCSVRHSESLFEICPKTTFSVMVWNIFVAKWFLILDVLRNVEVAPRCPQFYIDFSIENVLKFKYKSFFIFLKPSRIDAARRDRSTTLLYPWPLPKQFKMDDPEMFQVQVITITWTWTWTWPKMAKFTKYWLLREHICFLIHVFRPLTETCGNTNRRMGIQGTVKKMSPERLELTPPRNVHSHHN